MQSASAVTRMNRSLPLLDRECHQIREDMEVRKGRGDILEADTLPCDLKERLLAVQEEIELEKSALCRCISNLSDEWKVSVQNRRAAYLESLKYNKQVKELESKLAEACRNEEFMRADEINLALVEEESRAKIMSQEVTKTEEECRRAAWNLNKAEAKEVELSEQGAKKLLLVHEVRKGDRL